MSEDITMRQVIVGLCEACIDGIGEECHTPGCILWLHKVDIPIGHDLLVDAPIPLLWTTTPPTVEGWYWQRHSGEGFSYRRITLAYELKGELFWFIGDDMKTVSQFQGEWAGPLTPPVER